jgi:Helix-turn-helix domain
MTTSGDKPRCSDCGAQLRRDRAVGQRCDPCQRAGSRLVLPKDFYDEPELAAALAELEFGTVLRAVRAAQDWSQETLGELLGMTQGRISRIETGKRALLNFREVVAVADTLLIPAGKLGFIHGVTVGAGTTTGKKGSWVHRRDFGERVAALTLGLTGMAGLDIDRLTALLPHAAPTGTRHIGAADVETIEQSTAAYSRQDFATGAEPIKDLAVAHLRATLPLLGAQMSPEVRPRMYLATAHLATMVGWMSFQVKDDDAARRLWLIALDVARATDHPLGADHTVFVLYDMALQAVRLGRPDEALFLVHLGHAAATGPHPVSAATTSCLASIQARAHAAQGDAVGCDRALGQAIEHFSTIDQAPHESWGVSFLNEANLAGYQGEAYYELAVAKHDPRAAGRAAPLLRDAVEGLGPDYARIRASDLANLAGAHAIAGDTDTAVTVGHQAIDAVIAVHSPRAYDQLPVLNTALEPLRTSAGVVELRERLVSTAA